MNRWTNGACTALLSLVFAAGCGDGATPDPGEPENTAESAQAVTNCDVKAENELVITDLTVVGSDLAKPNGPWSFGVLLTNLAGNTDPQVFTKQFVESWLSNQVVDGLTLQARTRMEEIVLKPWRDPVTGIYDLAKAPMKLLAIVYRPDLRRQEGVGRDAGEGRFVFAVLRADGTPMPFTIIFEYGLSTQVASAAGWAKKFHALGALPIGTQPYNDALRAITDLFSGPHSAPGGKPGAFLHQLRTNEIALTLPFADLGPLPPGTAPLWQLREFHVENGLLKPARVALTPVFGFDGTATLGSYALQNADDIKEGSQRMPSKFKGIQFNGVSAEVPTPQFKWTVPGADETLRSALSLNTCNGCHAGETGTTFLQVGADKLGGPAILSTFVINHEIPFRIGEVQKLACP